MITKIKRFLFSHTDRRSRQRIDTWQLRVKREEDRMIQPLLKRRNLKFPEFHILKLRSEKMIESCHSEPQLLVSKKHFLDLALRGHNDGCYSAVEVRTFKKHIDNICSMQVRYIRSFETLADS